MPKDQEFFDFLNQGLEEMLAEEAEVDPDSPVLSEKPPADVSFNGSSLSPSIFTGDSAKPLSTGLFPESEVGDDNITNTWSGIMSYYG